MNALPLLLLVCGSRRARDGKSVQQAMGSSRGADDAVSGRQTEGRKEAGVRIISGTSASTPDLLPHSSLRV